MLLFPGLWFSHAGQLVSVEMVIRPIPVSSLARIQILRPYCSPNHHLVPPGNEQVFLQTLLSDTVQLVIISSSFVRLQCSPEPLQLLLTHTALQHHWRMQCWSVLVPSTGGLRACHQSMQPLQLCSWKTRVCFASQVPCTSSLLPPGGRPAPEAIPKL